MAYRNGTYIAFHADSNNVPGKTDIDYYHLMRAWSTKPDDDFTIVNSHEKVAAVRDSSSKETLRRSLHARLANSKNMVLIIGETTKNDNDWVPFEIEQAVDKYKIPIIAAYAVYDKPIRSAAAFSKYWPAALEKRINSGAAKVIHIPFKKAAIMDAMLFSPTNQPKGGLVVYSDEAYRAFGISD